MMWGWSVAAVAFLPYALWVLTRARWVPAFGIAAASLLATAVPMALVDRMFYGRWTVREVDEAASLKYHPQKLKITLLTLHWRN